MAHEKEGGEGFRLLLKFLVTHDYRTDNKNPETDIGVQLEGQKSKAASH